MLKNFLQKKQAVQKMPFFFFREIQLITVLFLINLQLLHQLKNKVRLSKTVSGTFYFRYHVVFIKVHIFAQQNAWTL